MEESYSSRGVEKEDGEVAGVDESHATSHSSRVSANARIGSTNFQSNIGYHGIIDRTDEDGKYYE
jgi:hypothetical protein